MKKVYVTPNMICEDFSANEYISACGEENKVYKFKCNAEAGPLYARDSDGKGYSGANYSPCGKTHEASVDSVFVDGYIDYNNNRKQDDGEAVKVWLEYSYDRRDEEWRVSNGHATTVIDMNSWETAKS